MFVRVLRGWFEEKQARFGEDYRNAVAPKQVRLRQWGAEYSGCGGGAVGAAEGWSGVGVGPKCGGVGFHVWRSRVLSVADKGSKCGGQGFHVWLTRIPSEADKGPK
eukprot:151039-Chlamydomonas_euryale.AAC.1